MTTKPDARPQPMPMERAILWNPSLQGDRTSGRAPYPIFFQQEAVIALQEHLKSSPLQAIFGFLIGNLYRDPETGVLYAVIDKTLRLNQAIYGDKTEIVVSRLWERMQQQLEKASGQLLGWYHSHPGQGGSLTPHDVETHEKYFTDPWQVAVLVAAEAGGVTGRFFRASGTADWAKTPLSFYELLQPDSVGADGKKRSFITWRNYKAFQTVSTKRPSPPPAPLPEQEQDDEDEQEDEQEDEAEAVPDEGFRIMRSSADDLPIIRSSMDDEAAPAAPIAPPPPPRSPPPPPPPPPPRASKPPPQAPVFFPDEPPVAPYDPGRPPELMHVSDPIPPPPPPAPFSPSEAREERRTPTHTFRLLDEEAPPPKAKTKGRRKGRRRWLSRLAMLLILGGAAAAGYWYFVMQQHGAEWVTKVRATVSRWTASSPPPAPPPARPPAAARPAAAPRAAPPPAPPAPPAAPVDTTFARFDRLTDTLSRAVRGYHERAVLFAGGQIDCATLARGLVAIENLWISYNTERRARMSAFDSRRAARDQGLYAGVDSVESQFERSGCSRP